MTRIIKLAVVFLMIGLLAGCTCLFGVKSPGPPGHAVASENHFENGVKQYNMGHYKQAIHQFNKAIEKDPTNYKAYFYLGMSHKGKGLMTQARNYLEKALGLSGNDASWTAKIRNQLNIMTQEKEKNKGKGKGKDKDK